MQKSPQPEVQINHSVLGKGLGSHDWQEGNFYTIGLKSRLMLLLFRKTAGKAGLKRF